MSRALPEISLPELSALVRAVRGGASTARSHKDLRAAAAAFLVILATLLHSAGAGAWNSREAHSRASHEESKMKFSARGVMVASALAVSSGAVAQNAVQWRVEDGGNGHWYKLVISGAITWSDARSACESKGGHLVTPTSADEDTFLLSIANREAHPDAWVDTLGGNAGGPWLGGYQPTDASPSQPWAWVTGEPWIWVGWAQGEPNGGFRPGDGITAMLGYHSSNQYRGWADGGLTDFPPYDLCRSFVIEWSADCNNDGIVDYGQIRAGELADENNNNVPDCCEQGAPCNLGHYPVQWRAEDGGNGHWYQVRAVAPVPASRQAQELIASALGGKMATIDGQSEDAFVDGLLVHMPPGWEHAAWIGLYRSSISGSDWVWTDGAPLKWQNWGIGSCISGPYPNDETIQGELGTMIYNQGCGLYWDDAPLAWVTNPPPWWTSTSDMKLLIEWSADCNNDGIVDYGQIRSGELVDTNSNNIPDCCETLVGCCPGDVDNSGLVDGADLSAVLNNWGTDGGKFPSADANQDGVVNGADLTVILTAWGPCH